MFDIFLSHCTPDKSFVIKFDLALQQRGFTTFRDDKNISYGSDIPRSVYSNLESSTYFFCFISQHYQHSYWVQKERATAEVLRLPIIPILIDNIEIPTEFKTLNTAFFLDREIDLLLFEDIVEGLVSSGTYDTGSRFSSYLEKGVKEMEASLYESAIRHFEKAKQTQTDNAHIDLLIIACKISGRSIYHMNLTYVDRYVKTLCCNQYKNNSLAMLLLALLHIEFYKRRSIIPPGLQTDEVLKEVRKLPTNERNRSELQGCKLSAKSLVILGLKK